MQSKVFVEEATGLPPEPDLTPELLVPEEEGYLMEGYALAPLKQDVVYSVVVQLKSPTENTTSQPVYGKMGGWVANDVWGGLSFRCHLEGISVRSEGWLPWKFVGSIYISSHVWSLTVAVRRNIRNMALSKAH